MGNRIEKDFLGEKQIPDDAYYGVQTAARQGELPHHRHADVAGAVLRQGLRLREEGRRAWPTATWACSIPRSPTRSSARATG